MSRLSWAEREAYRIDKAKILIEPAVANLTGIWADFGCGDGIFTSALHTLLGEPHQIYGVDKNKRSLRALAANFAESYPAAQLQTIQADFSRPVSVPPLDGLLMANSLHFIRHKTHVLAHLVNLLKPGGRFIIIEYNASRGNWAVPHPFDEYGFVDLMTEVGLTQTQIVAKIPSRFLNEMYAGMAVKGG